MKIRSQFTRLFFAACLTLFGIFSIPVAGKESGLERYSSGIGNNDALKTCRVTKSGGARAFVVRTGNYTHLSKGTSLILMSRQYKQGLILVKSRVGGRLVELNIDYEDTNCLS